MRLKTKFTEPPEIVEAEKKIIEYFTKIDPERFAKNRRKRQKKKIERIKNKETK